jgi:pimeloyl-ACP methyl ester carboxylesterase
MLAMQYVLDRLPEIGVPTLLVGGRYDECTPGHLEEIHRRIAGSQLVIIEDASHLCFAEKPEEFNQVISVFLDRTAGARALA